MQQLAQDIKNQTFKQVYLLYGEEHYLRKQYRDKLKEVLIPADDTMNYHYFEGKDINVGEIIDLAETLPFFADKRIIFIEDSGLCKSGGERLAEYLLAPSESVIIVMVEAQVDNRSKLFKVIKDKGRACEFAPQDDNTLKRWIVGIVKKENKTINDNALNLLLEKTGTDMANIRSELEKLFCYTLKKNEISVEDIQEICTQRISNRIFEMVAAIAEKRQKTALDMYHDLLLLKESPLGILALISRQFNLMMQVKELQQKSLSPKTIGEKTNLSPYIVQKYEKQAAKFKMADLRKALEACANADEAVKKGKLNDVLSVELLIIEYSK